MTDNTCTASSFLLPIKPSLLILLELHYLIRSCHWLVSPSRAPRINNYDGPRVDPICNWLEWSSFTTTVFGILPTEIPGFRLHLEYHLRKKFIRIVKERQYQHLATLLFEFPENKARHCSPSSVPNVGILLIPSENSPLAVFSLLGGGGGWPTERRLYRYSSKYWYHHHCLDRNSDVPELSPSDLALRVDTFPPLELFQPPTLRTCPTVISSVTLIYSQLTPTSVVYERCCDKLPTKCHWSTLMTHGTNPKNFINYLIVPSIK